MDRKYRVNGVVLRSLPTIEEYDTELEKWVPAKPTGGNSIGSFAASVVIVDSEEEATDPNILYLIRN